MGRLREYQEGKVENQRDACVSVLVLREAENKILLVLNKEELNRPSKWGMPRGRRDPEDETERDTGKRETKEETGFAVLIDFRYEVEEPADGYTHIAFLGYPAGGSLEINADEIVDAKWFPVRSLWTRDPNHPGYVDMHPRQRRMARNLLYQRRKDSQEKISKEG